MTNKNIALISIVGLGIFIVSFTVNPGEEGAIYWGSLLAFYIGTIWGWVRLMK